MNKSAIAQSPSRTGATPRDDRVFLVTRIAALGVIIILVLAVAVLYFQPDQTDRYFAWTIKPLLTPLAMGAGYLMGIYFFVRALTTRRWHQVAAGFLPITAFTIFMLLATLLHLDRFNQGTLAFTLWLVIYILTPVLVPVLWLNNRRTDPQTAEANEMLIPPRLRQSFGAVGLVVLVLGLMAFVFPDLAIRVFPWKLTPLTARVIAGWMMLPGVGGIVLSREPRWSSWRVLFEAAMVAVVFFALALPRAWGDLDQSNPLTWGLLALLVLLVVGLPLFYYSMQTRRFQVSAPELNTSSSRARRV